MDTPRQVIGGLLIEKKMEPWLASEIVAALDTAGYVILPREPNQTMIAEGGVAFEDALFGECKLVFDGAEDCYKAMVAAGDISADR